MSLLTTNANKLQASLSEKVVADGHGCHTALNFGVKAKQIKTMRFRYTGFINAIKNLYKYLLHILVLV